MKLVIADEARDELARIGERIARDNPRRAVAFVDEIESHCHRISATLLTHPLLPGREATRLRRAVHGNYLIFYRVDPDHVVIVHVLHGARDYDAILFPDG
jgi:toxin ParE1/3/4